MALLPSDPPAILGIGTDVWRMFFRHLLQIAAGALAAHGLIASSTLSDVTLQIGVAVLMSGLSFVLAKMSVNKNRPPQ